MKPAVGGETAASVSEKKKKNKSKVPTLEEYLQQRDYLGALTLLEVPPTPPHLSIYLSVCPYKSDLLKIMFINHALQYSYDFFLITFVLYSSREVSESKRSTQTFGLAFVPFIWGITRELWRYFYTVVSLHDVVKQFMKS